MADLSKQLERFRGDTFSAYDPKTGAGLQRSEPTEDEVREPYAAPGRDADVELGVLYRADHETLEDGLCRQARAHARALAAELPVALRSVNNRVRIKDPVTGERIVVLGSDDALAPAVYAEVGELRRRTVRRNAVCVNHTVITSAANLWRLLVPGYAQNDPKAVESILAASIVYTPWERDRVDADTIALLNNVGQVWLQCEANVRAFTASGLNPEKVRLVPNAFDEHAPLYALWRERSGAPQTHLGRRFYTIGKWEPRKGHHQLIGAFLRTFSPSEAATLYIKTYEYRPWPGYPSIDESIAAWLDDPSVKEKGWTPGNFRAGLFVDTRYVSDQGIAEIHLQNDIYVSASHAEGWDYPAFDAVSIGNRLIHVGFGGSEDYAPADSVQIAWEPGPVDPAYEWGDAQWAHFSLEALAAALSHARVAPPPAAVPVESVLRYRTADIGALMARHVRELAAATGQELP